MRSGKHVLPLLTRTIRPDFDGRMRKTVLILLGVVLYLLLGASGAIPAGSQPERIRPSHGAWLVQDGTLDEYACERVCNSDLQLPATVRLAAPCATERQRGFDASERAPLTRGCRWLACGRRQRGYSVHHVYMFPAGARAADYYVYLLRRLLI